MRVKDFPSRDAEYLFFQGSKVRGGEEMNLFHLHIEAEHDAMFRPHTWIVIAGSLRDALSVVPDGLSVKSVQIQPGIAVDPRRRVDRTDAPVIQ